MTFSTHKKQWKLFLDDERFPDQYFDDLGSWTLCRNYTDAKWHVEKFGIPTDMSLDHDLGMDFSGMDFVKWLCDHVMEHDLGSDFAKIKYQVHSMNPVGRQNMQSYLDNFKKDWIEYERLD